MLIKYELVVNEGPLSELDRAIRYVLSNDTIAIEADFRREVPPRVGQHAVAQRGMMQHAAALLGWVVAWNARLPASVLVANRGLNGIAYPESFARTILEDLGCRLRNMGVEAQVIQLANFGTRRMVYGDPRAAIARYTSGNPPVLRFSFYPREDAQVAAAKHLGQPLVDEVSFLVVLGTGLVPITNPANIPVYMFRETRTAALDDVLLQTRQEWAVREREGLYPAEAGAVSPYALHSYRGGAAARAVKYKYVRDLHPVFTPFPNTRNNDLRDLYCNLTETIRYWTTLLAAENEGIESRNTRSNAVSFTRGRVDFIKKSTARAALELPGKIHTRLDSAIDLQARIITTVDDLEVDRVTAARAGQCAHVEPELCDMQIQLLCELAGVPAVEVPDVR